MPDVQIYLLQKKYKVHPCRELNEHIDTQQRCTMFRSNLPPANEVSLFLFLRFMLTFPTSQI